jgi:hypothetical protein
MAAGRHRVDRFKDGALDDVVIDGPIALGRLEMLGRKWLWGAFYVDGEQRRFSFYVRADKGKLIVSGEWETTT